MDNPPLIGMKRKAAEEAEAELEAKRPATLVEIRHTLEKINDIIEIEGFVIEHKHDLSTNTFIFIITDNNNRVSI